MPLDPTGGENAVIEGIRLLCEAQAKGIKLSYRKAALLAGCKHDTLRYRFLGKRQPLATVKRNATATLLCEQTEKELVNWLIFLDDWDTPVTYDIVREKALKLARIRNPDVEKIGSKWIQRFLKRQPEIRGRLSAQLDRDRAKAGNAKVLRDFYAKWHDIIVRFGIRPEDIYNFDEKGVLIGRTSRQWVITRRSKKTPYAIQDGSRESVTVIECIRAGIPQTLSDNEDCAPATLPIPSLLADTAPHAIPPFFITSGDSYTAGNFKYIFANEYGQPNILAGAAYYKSPKGYTNKQIGLYYLVRHFDFHTRQNGGLKGKPRLLLLDGHNSHLSLDVVQYAMDNNIHLLCLPAHTTHLLQPLDVGVFRPLQNEYGKAVSQWTRDGNGRMSFASFLL